MDAEIEVWIDEVCCACASQRASVYDSPNVLESSRSLQSIACVYTYAYTCEIARVSYFMRMHVCVRDKFSFMFFFAIDGG